MGRWVCIMVGIGLTGGAMSAWPAKTQDRPPQLRIPPRVIAASPTPTPTPTPAPSPARAPSTLSLPTAATAISPQRTARWADSVATSITPPSDLPAPAKPASVTLRAGGHDDFIRVTPQLRQIPAATLRAGGQVTIGSATVDFRSMVNNPRALPNIAQQLRRMPQLVEVRGEVLEAAEIQQGLVVRSLLTYNFRPGACSDAMRRRQIAATGVRCLESMSDAARAAAFANPADPRYVADPAKRAVALNAARTDAAKIAADIAVSVATFRAQLANPAQRAAIVAEVGEAEASRLAALDDTALAGELANTAETKIEQVAFIPRVGALTTLAQVPVAGNLKLAQVPFGKQVDTGALSLPAPPPPPKPVSIQSSFATGDYVFLTGFTLGREYEWRQRIETTIKWCLVGCKKTYYAELFAGFNYGFGLRFPLKFSGEYKYDKTGSVETATLKTRVTPINGSPADYSAAGLMDAKIFDGKEFVAQVGAHAGASAKLPVVGTYGVDFSVGFDFTQMLPAPFTGGQFLPPTPGLPGPKAEKIFDDFDLIGGRANFGVFGGQVFPAVRVELTSGKLEMTLRDKGNGKIVKLGASEQTVPLFVNAADASSSNLVLSDPVYNVALQVTPGINARLFIDLAAWSTQWNWPIWFPQLSVQLPPGGMTFVCHDGTICSRDFRFTPKGFVTKGNEGGFVADIEVRGDKFADKWTPLCLDETCRFGIKFVRLGAVLNAKKKFAANPNLTLAMVEPDFAAADKEAQTLITESETRKKVSGVESFAVLAEAVWSKRCEDKICFDQIKALAKQMGPRAKQVAQANPDMSQLEVTGQVGKEFAPKFQAAVDASKARVGK